MSIRSLIPALAVGCLTVGCVGDESAEEALTGAEEQESSTLWKCKNAKSAVSCVGLVAAFPITIDVKNVRALNSAELNILNLDLSNFSLLNQNEVDVNNVLNGLELTVLNDFLNKFKINVTNNDINVCATVLIGGLICK